MDRCGVFVDAGYLLAEAGGLCLGTKSRAAIQLDYPAAISALLDFATGHGGHEPLRLYWYDAAPNAVALPDHQRIGALPHVKVRLGRLVGPKDRRQQKGVDSLVVRDLIVLAQERAICTAYVLAGDEDLREGVATAQERGMQVVLLGIPTTGGLLNQAASLIREVDEHLVLQKPFWDPYLTAAAIPTAPTTLPPAAPVPPSPEAIKEAGRAFAATWLRGATPEEIARLLEASPVIPVELDARLLAEAEMHVGTSMRGQTEARKYLRAAFWDTIRTEATKPHEGPEKAIAAAPPESN